ncbi:MAG: phosphoribosyltransferase [Planctomycetota bacterium]|jgi:hypoxanthine phosphoribosyltransferase
MTEIYLTAEAIDARVRELGTQVRGRGGEGTLVLIGVLKGAVLFFADLARAIAGPTEFAFVRARSYGAGTRDRIVEAGAASVLTCVLLDKPSRREIEMEADLVGFTVPDRFLIGYGLDHAGQYRGLRDLAVL